MHAREVRRERRSPAGPGVSRPDSRASHPAPAVRFLVAACTVWLASGWILAASPAASASTLGLLLEPDEALTVGAAIAGPGPGSPPLVRLRADRARVESGAGVFDWSAHEAAVSVLRGAGLRVALALTGSAALDDGAAPSPLVPGSLDAWLAFVRAAVRQFHGRVELFEVGDGLRQAGADADAFALVIKLSSLALRAEASAHGAQALVAPGVTDAHDAAWLAALWERDLAPYIDVLPVAVDSAAGPEAVAASVRAVRVASLSHPPAPALWVYTREGAEWDAPAAAVAALAAGADVAVVPPGSGLVERARWVEGLQALLGSGFARAPLGAVRLVYPGGPVPPSARVLGRFFEERSFDSLVVFVAPDPVGAGGPPQLVVDVIAASEARLIDPASGESRRVTAASPSDGSAGRALALRTGAVPQAALFRRRGASPGLDLPAEELDVASTRGLTAEEIISRHQLVQREQDDRLERWTARGRIDFHFKLGQAGSTIDVAIDSNYFWERGGELEWEQTEYYINGNRVTWKSFPELPLIQPEKVITLPLDLTLNRTYSYRLAGQERVGDRTAYVLEFAPAEGGAALNLYRGRVWIDAAQFVRLKLSLVQGELEPPVLSNEETDRYAPQTGPDGADFWLFSAIDGQQVWNTAGRTFVVRRQVTFLDYEINPPSEEFARRRAAAHASNHQMLRDTPQGFRYLARRPDGTREVRQEADSSQLFAAAGAFHDGSRDHVIPLAGVNYFDYDFGRHHSQLNVLFAGVFAFATLSRPGPLGGRGDLTADAGLSALYGDDRLFVGGDEVEAERIESRDQSLALRLGLPAGQFVKLNLIARLNYVQYSTDGDAGDALGRWNERTGSTLEFVLPRDHAELAAELETEFNRRGVTLAASGRWARRSAWEAWGLRDAASGEFGHLAAAGFVPGAEPVEERYARLGATVFKEWYLPRFQKLRGEAGWLDGSRLDRFSRYRFGFFGEDRLNGFSGSGVRFDRGLVGRAGYSFNLFELIRLDLALDTARVEDRSSGAGRQSFSGLGLSTSFVAPWKTVVNFNYGYALDSDIPDLEGEQEFLLLVLKLF